MASEPLIIVYHGTSKKNSETIIEEGFKPNTYFALHLEDAIGYGGRCVFEVAHPKRLAKTWQFTCKEHIPPSQIISLRKYRLSKLFSDETQRARVFKSNMTKEELKHLCEHIRANPKQYTKTEWQVFVKEVLR